MMGVTSSITSKAYLALYHPQRALQILNGVIVLEACKVKNSPDAFKLEPTLPLWLANFLIVVWQCVNGGWVPAVVAHP